MEEIYDVLTIVEISPQDVDNQKNRLTVGQYMQLKRYHELRSKTFGYSDKNGMYRFYIMSWRANIKQPFIRKNIQVSVRLNSSDIPTV